MAPTSFRKDTGPEFWGHEDLVRQNLLPSGPLSGRAGWEQVAQSMLGICHDSGAEQPALLPVPACDYLTGYLGAYGILLALARRAVEGGSYHVNVSLCQSGMMLNRRGRVASSAEAVPLTETEARSL